MVVGYAGGFEPYPTYRSIKDYTEAIRVTYNPNLISYEKILEEYSRQNGDPTYKGFGTQYRSAILYHNMNQKMAAEQLIKKLQSQYSKTKTIYIDVEPATDFYRGEEYHQKYYRKNRM